MTPVVPFVAFNTNTAKSFSSSEALTGRVSEQLLRLSGTWAAGTDEWSDETVGIFQNKAGAARKNSGASTRSSLLNQAFSQLKKERLDLLNKAVSRVTAEPTIQPSRITGMEKWDGRILEVDEEFFSAELTPFEGGEQVIADFPRDLLPDDDINAGDVIYVTARTVAFRGGPSRTSSVRLRRLGTWTESEIAENSRLAKEDEAELAKYFD